MAVVLPSILIQGINGMVIPCPNHSLDVTGSRMTNSSMGSSYNPVTNDIPATERKQFPT